MSLLIRDDVGVFRSIGWQQRSPPWAEGPEPQPHALVTSQPQLKLPQLGISMLAGSPPDPRLAPAPDLLLRACECECACQRTWTQS